jgi:hypothetical protein
MTVSFIRLEMVALAPFVPSIWKGQVHSLIILCVGISLYAAGAGRFWPLINSPVGLWASTVRHQSWRGRVTAPTRDS